MKLKVGEKIGAGAQHHVYKMGDEVVKIPSKWGQFWSQLSFGCLEKHHDILTDCPIQPVSSHLIERPEVLIDGKLIQPNYAIVQEFVKCRVMNELDLNKEELAFQVKDAVDFSVDLLKQDKLAVDFLGFEALIQCLKSFFTNSPLGVYNIFMTDDGLRLLDTGLFDFNQISVPFKPIVWSLANFQHEALSYVNSCYQPENSYQVHSNWVYSQLAQKLYQLLVYFRPQGLLK